jgi:hypothetical protein
MMRGALGSVKEKARCRFKVQGSDYCTTIFIGDNVFEEHNGFNAKEFEVFEALLTVDLTSF